MTRAVVVAGDRRYTVATDDGAPVAERWWALATGRLVDELTGEPPTAPPRVTLGRIGLYFKPGRDGTFAIVTRPWLAFPPLLAPQYTLPLRFEADGYLPHALDATLSSAQRAIVAPAPAAGTSNVALASVADLAADQRVEIGPAGATRERARIDTVGPGANLTLSGALYHAHAVGDPLVADAWTPLALGTLALRRAPVTIRGRTVRRDPGTGATMPVPNATLTVVNFWSTLAAFRSHAPGEMTPVNPALVRFLAAVSPGVRAARAAGAVDVQLQAMPEAPGSSRRLDADVAAGDTALALTRRDGIAIGDALRIDADDAHDHEVVTVAAVSGYGAPDAPGVAELVRGVARPHRAGARVARCAPLAAMPVRQLQRDAAPGDRTLFVDDATGLGTGSDVRLHDAAAPDEWQRTVPFQATSDADGYFEFPPLHRVAVLRLKADAPPLTAVELSLHPDYGAREQRIAVEFA